MKRKRKFAARLISGIAIVAAFSYGVVVGRYQVFPYEQLKAFKSLTVGGDGRSTQVTESPRSTPNYLNRLSIHDGIEVSADVVMIGDSFTDYAEWSEMFPGVSIANRGIVGDTTERVLNRLDTIAATGAQTALIMVGVNDISGGSRPEEILTNYDVILDYLLASGMTPYIQSTLFVGRHRHENNAQIAVLNDGLRDLARRKNIKFIDLNEKLAPDGVLDDQYTIDELHLNAAGYLVWRDVISPIVVEHAFSQNSKVKSAVSSLERRPD